VTRSPLFRRLRLGFACAFVALTSAAAEAQLARRPFAVGGGEGGGGASGGLTGWLLAEQSRLTHVMAASLKALHSEPAAIWGLIGLGFAYGVFHAAGPGHGKAVIASYMMANDRALRRGVALAFLAALLQGAVAIGLVGLAALLFNATAAEMNRAADLMALASYLGIVAIGLWLVWTKGSALIAALGAAAFRARAPGETTTAVDGCGCALVPDMGALNAPFSWRGAAATVLAAGARPCSGAILMLVFALSQGLFAAGVAATYAMSMGTAITTGALACGAVFAKALAMRFAAGEESRVALAARGVEFLAALLVLAFGVALLVGARGAA